jgi:transcriptional regulator GlxA family with amidase domain
MATDRQTLASHIVLMVAFPPAQSLDVVGVMEVFADANRRLDEQGRPPFYRVILAGPAAGAIETSSGVQLVAPIGLDTLDFQPDTLILGSGPGARASTQDAELIAKVRAVAVRAPRVASVCTGAFPLAATGLLKGRRVATHWARCALLEQRFPDLTVDPDAIFVSDGKFHTSAGGTAGIDLALSLVEADLGRGIALAVARQLVVFLKRPGGQSQFSGHMMTQVSEENGRFSRLAQWILENLDEDLSVVSLAQRAAMSPRNFARRFNSEMGMTPAQYVQRLRMDSARRLLTEGDLPTSEIATRCGFGTMETMRAAFQRHLHVAPHHFRARFRLNAIEPFQNESPLGRPLHTLAPPTRH